ncbi:MAG: tetratricopeptide repeat protein, partial [Rudaea sp.]
MSILYTLKFLRNLTLCSVGAVALVACASVPTGAEPATAARQPLQRVIVPPDTAQRELLTHLLAGELALGGNDLDGATREFAAAAQLSDDPVVAEQAAHIAIAGKRWDVARAVTARWQTLKADDNGLRQVRAMLALHDGDAETAYAQLTRLLQQPDGAGWRPVSQALLSAQDRALAGNLTERLLAADTAKAGLLKTQTLGSKPEVWIAVSQMALRLGKKALAQTLAERSVSRFATPETYAWAAQVKLGAGDKDGARELFTDA